MSEIRVENIIGETGTDAVKFTKGINVTGIATATNVSVGSSVTASTFHGNGAGLTNVTAGKILQVDQQVRTDTTSTGTSTYADVFTVTLTPTSSTSKFLLLADLKISYSSYTAAVMWKFVRTISGTSTDVFIGDASGSRSRCTWGTEEGGHNNSAVYVIDSTNGIFLDDRPDGTSPVNYKIQWKTEQATAYLNRTGGDGNTAAYPRTASSLTVMEVSA